MPWVTEEIPWFEKPGFNDDYKLRDTVNPGRADVYLCNEGKGARLYSAGFESSSEIVGASWRYDKNRGWYLNHNGIGSYEVISSSLKLSGASPFTVAVTVRPTSLSRHIVGPYAYTFDAADLDGWGGVLGNAEVHIALFQDSWSWSLFDGTSFYRNLSVAPAAINSIARIIFTFDGDYLYFYLDGVLVDMLAVSPNFPPGTAFVYVNRPGNNDNDEIFVGDMYDYTLSSSSWSQTDVEQDYYNQYNFLKPRTRQVYYPTASSSGSTVPLTGATVSLATANGAITASIPITGTAANIANANGALSAVISLSGAAVAEAIATAALASGSPLSGDAISVAIASGGVTVNFNLDGNAVAEASATADLTLGGSVPLSGSASASADAGVVPTMDVPISGASISTSGANGSPGVIFPVSGAAASVTTVVGSLNIGIGIAANASAELLADGVITFKVNLDSAAVAQASAAGALSLGGQHRLPPPERLNVVAFERRIERVKLVSF